eukprot:7063290-Alexandrium_andersonii.AAC.1
MIPAPSREPRRADLIREGPGAGLPGVPHPRTLHFRSQARAKTRFEARLLVGAQRRGPGSFMEEAAASEQCDGPTPSKPRVSTSRSDQGGAWSGPP